VDKGHITKLFVFLRLAYYMKEGIIWFHGRYPV